MAFDKKVLRATVHWHRRKVNDYRWLSKHKPTDYNRDLFSHHERMFNMLARQYRELFHEDP